MASDRLQYNQLRRDNEVEAREELDKRLPTGSFHTDFNERGDFNPTTKSLLAALRFLDPDAQVHSSSSTNRLDSAEYNQLRRTNEITVKDKVRALVPDRFFTGALTSRGDFNPVTKVLIASTLYIKQIREESRVDKMAPPARLADFQRATNVTLKHSEVDEIPDSQESSDDDSEQIIVPARHAENPVALRQNLHKRSFEEASTTDLDEDDSTTKALTTNRFRKMAITRSSNKAKAQAKDTAKDTTESDQNIPTARPFEGIDLLANLRAQQQEDDSRPLLDLQPPRLPTPDTPLKKSVQVQGRWELKLRNPRNAPHENENVRALEQAANRLVAKAKEMCASMEDDEEGCNKRVMEVHDMCVDSIELLGGSMSLKQYKGKWNKIKGQWVEEYGVQFD